MTLKPNLTQSHTKVKHTNLFIFQNRSTDYPEPQNAKFQTITYELVRFELSHQQATSITWTYTLISKLGKIAKKTRIKLQPKRI